MPYHVPRVMYAVTSQEEIKEEIEKVCSVLPQTVRRRCRSFVDIYGDLIINYLAQSIDPAEICIRLKLCKESNVALMLDSGKSTPSVVHMVSKSFCQLLQ